MIFSEIKKASIIALKEKDQTARTIYGIILNKAMLENIKKKERNDELSDIEMVQIIQKTIKELSEEAENYKKVGNFSEEVNVLKQKSLIEIYLPKMLTSEEIKNIINGLSDKSIPGIMKFFKTEYAGKCDMRLVNEIARTFN